MVLNRRALLKLASLAPLGRSVGLAPAFAEDLAFRHGTSLLGSLKYAAGFSNFDYVNLAAPKGGRIRLGVQGSFDSLNIATLKGDPVDPGVNETLMTPSFDEASSEYGLLAEGLWYPEDYSRAVYRLREGARFHDGKPVTPDDVIFSLESFKTNLTTRAAYFRDIVKAEQTGERDVTFVFAKSGNRELPHITGQLAILPKHWWTAKDAAGRQRDVSASSLEPPLGSGPYKVALVKPSFSVLVSRVDDYWGKDLAVNKGQNNFDEIETQYYRDPTVLFEAFKGDQFDLIQETAAKNWATGYDFPAIKDGRCLKEEVKQEGVKGMQAWVINLRRPKFQDIRVRKALNLAFDFEWSNANLFYGQYQRSRSYFNNSELEATGLPSPEELALLEPLRDKLPPEVFTTEYANPVNTTSQDRRKNLRAAQALLAEAGWNGEAKGGKRVLRNAKGEEFTLDFVLYSDAFERIALPYKEQLELLGFNVSVRTIDMAQYKRVQDNFEYDLLVGSWGQSLSPGNEQREYWGSEFANRPGSKNYCGIQNPAVDIIVDKLINAPDRAALVAATHALDRALIWNAYVVPMWFLPHARLAYWRRIRHPEKLPGYSLAYPSIWWWDEKAAAELQKT